MQERIYTIPVNEAFESAAGVCPFCALRAKLENDELGLILGASMMEPDIRILTNKVGFCRRHYAMMFARNNRLQMALTLESHLDELKRDLKPGGLLVKDKGARPAERIEKLENSCYVCERVEDNISKMFRTAAYLYAEEPEFAKKFKSRDMFCLPDYKRLIVTARSCLPRAEYAQLCDDAHTIVSSYLDTLSEDVSWFCQKFDYRNENEPWGNSRDSVERAIKFLRGAQALDLKATK